MFRRKEVLIASGKQRCTYHNCKNLASLLSLKDMLKFWLTNKSCLALKSCPVLVQVSVPAILILMSTCENFDLHGLN